MILLLVFFTRCSVSSERILGHCLGSASCNHSMPDANYQFAPESRGEVVEGENAQVERQRSEDFDPIPHKEYYLVTATQKSLKKVDFSDSERAQSILRHIGNSFSNDKEM
jgi:hypothetical protein